MSACSSPTDPRCAAARPWILALVAVMAAKTISYTVGLCLLLISASSDWWSMGIWITATEVAAGGARFVVTRRIERIAGWPARRFWPHWIVLAALLGALLLLSR